MGLRPVLAGWNERVIEKIALWCLRAPDLATGRLVYCLNFVVIRSTASFTSPPALSM